MSASNVSFPALRHGGFRAYFIWSALAMMADSVEHVISYWVIFQKFHSQTLGGFAIISHWVPFLLFSVYAGALADRFDPRRLIQIGMGLFIFVSAAWGYLFVTDTLEMWHAAALLVIHGFAGVLWSPPSQLFIQYMVDAKLLPSAVRLMATARWLGLLVGPAVGSVLMLAFGPWKGIFINVLFYLPFLIWLGIARYGPRFSDEPRAAAMPIRGVSEIWETIRAAARHRTIMAMTLLAGAASFFVGNAYQAQMPEFSEHLGHGDAGAGYGMLLAADAAGALIAGIVLESRGLLQPSPRKAFVLAMLWCFAIAGFAMTRFYPLAWTLLFIAGFLQLAFSAMAQAIVQIEAPREIRGRMIGLYNMSSLGLRAFAGVTVGILGAAIGIHWSLAASAIMLLAVVTALLAFTLRGR